jgi:mitogen-activated protein kinase kinase kinase 17/18
MATAVSGRWTRVRTLGRGASGAVVSLAADEASGGLFAVKSVPAAAAEQLRREGSIQSALRSPHVLPCLGFRADAAGGECQLFLEYAPGGTLADAAARSGGRLDESAVRAYAADVARGLAYLHGLSLVHGDVKARNVVVGADGRAKLADFGCARPADSSARQIGGTPAFMAPEVARGEEQGLAADVWALGCTVVEMATGRAPWSDVGDVLAAVHRIGFTDATPEVPDWLSPEAKGFLARCFARNPRDRCTAAQLSEHPFLASPGCGVKAEEVPAKWVSPKSTLDAALWESDTDEEDAEMAQSCAERMKALAGPCSSSLPDWDSDEGWIQVLDEHCEPCNSVLVPTKETAVEHECVLVSEIIEAEAEFGDAEHGVTLCSVAVGLAARSAEQQPQEKLIHPYFLFIVHVCHSTRNEMSEPFLPPNCPLLPIPPVVPAPLVPQIDSEMIHIGNTKSRTRQHVHILWPVSGSGMAGSVYPFSCFWRDAKMATHLIWDFPGYRILAILVLAFFFQLGTLINRATHWQSTIRPPN